MCAPCAAKAASANKVMNAPVNPIAKTDINKQNCSITKELLVKWQGILFCVKKNNVLEKVGLVYQTANQLMGILQSAVNYPDNYCYYRPQLEMFQNNILPRIVANVPECINE